VMARGYLLVSYSITVRREAESGPSRAPGLSRNGGYVAEVAVMMQLVCMCVTERNIQFSRQ
jgi:hypothetical protein